jgi:hypothetical protein
MIEVVAILLVAFNGPAGQRIDVNPAEVTSVREPSVANKTYFAEGVRCLIGLVNGRFVAVADNCMEVRQKLRGGEPDQAPCVLMCGGTR